MSPGPSASEFTDREHPEVGCKGFAFDRRHRSATVGAFLATVFLLCLMTGPVSAQSAPQLSTPYPDVAVEAGTSVTFPLRISSSGRRRVALDVADVPRGWTATLRGGGFVVHGVVTDPDTPPTVDLEVEVPPEARPGSHTIVVTARTGGVTTRLPLELRIEREVAGAVSLEAEFPQLQGAADTPFTFNLTLENDTPRELRFNLDAVGPEGWIVSASPSGQTQAATATVAGGSSTTITVEADAPDDAAAGSYPLQVTASAGSQTVTTDLEAEVTGSFALTLTTPDERLNAEVTAGGASPVQLLVINDGSSPLVDVSLTATPPGEWEVTFEPERIDQIPPGESAPMTALITPSGDAVAGDYLVNFSASAGEATGDIELRTTVQTSAAWGVVGLVLIVIAFAALFAVFRRFGRR